MIGPMVDSDKPTTAYTLDADAPAAAVVVVYRAALAAMRDRLVDLSVDLVSDGPWPDEVLWALEALQPRTIQRRPLLRPWTTQPGVTVGLDPRDNMDFELASALVPWTIYAEGIANDRSIAYSANDTGTSAVFELTVDEHAELLAQLTASNVDPELLRVFPRKHKTYT